MTETAYQKLIDFQADLQRRATILRGREGEIIASLSEREEAFPEAVILGQAKRAQAEIDTLNLELANLRKELAALSNPPVGPDSRLGKLIQAAWQESVDEITGPLREEWDAEVVELEKARTMLLKAVTELGGIKRKADAISNRINGALLSIPGPKMVAPTLSTGIYEHSKTGVIYLSPDEVERAYIGEK
jgi:hypothetical protein